MSTTSIPQRMEYQYRVYISFELKVSKNFGVDGLAAQKWLGSTQTSKQSCLAEGRHCGIAATV